MRFPEAELQMLVDGVEMDFSRSRYATFEELRAYCNLVASVVGRMCVRIFGFDDPVALERADDLGLALQLTNILRDVREDAVDMKRVYLPQDELARFGISDTSLADGEILPGWDDLVAHHVARARALFRDGLRGVAAYSAPAGRVRRDDGGHLRGAPEEDRARSRAAAARARGALQDGETASRSAVVALERVAVVGAGLAGLAAALRLKDAGAHVELFERSRLLGGRATSFEIDGVEVDNGQHVFLACCTEFVRFARVIGMEDKLRLQTRFDARILSRDGKTGHLRAAPLPAPLHLLPSFATYPHLTPGEKVRIGSSLVMLTLSKHDQATTETFEQWLQRNKTRRGRAPRVLGSVLHSGAERAVRQGERRRRAVRAEDGVLARRVSGALRILDGTARAPRARSGAAPRRRARVDVRFPCQPELVERRRSGNPEPV